MSEVVGIKLMGREALAHVAQLRAEATRVEREAIVDALERTEGSERRAGEILGLDRDAIHALLRRRYPDLAALAGDMRTRVRGHAGGGRPRRGSAATSDPGPAPALPPVPALGDVQGA